MNDITPTCGDISDGNINVYAEDLTPFEDSRNLNMGRMGRALRRGRRRGLGGKEGILLLGLLLPVAAGQSDSAGKCVSLATSTTCSAFNTASISLSITDKFPFLQFVNDTSQFDQEFERYIRTDYTLSKYKNGFGCALNDFSNTTDLYARYTRSQLCSAMIQESISDCGLSTEEAKPLCVDSCGQWASSEYQIVSDKATCGTTRSFIDAIRADFVVCSLPSNSLNTQLCVDADLNEGANCGFSDNLPGLCLHCQGGTVNSTETCCYEAKVEERCQGVVLPDIADIPDNLLPTTTSTPSATPTPGGNGSEGGNSGGSKLSGGAIAGIVIGAVAFIALLIFLLLVLRRRRAHAAAALYLNRPSPRRSTPDRGAQASSQQSPPPTQEYDNVAGGRIARMSALESNTPSVTDANAPPPLPLQDRPSHRVISNTSREFGLEDSPDTRRSAKFTPEHRPLHPPPRDRNASLSSTSVLAGGSDSEKEDSSSPQLSSPLSEQLPYFKDYYSKDDIHPHDKVSVLWAYSPRAADEFELERGDMLRVIGIWDDGWATGVRISERAEEYVRRRTQRDSGVSASQNSRASIQPSTPPADREVKAFPLVCVCLPEHWQKTIENDGVDYTSSHTTEGQLSDPETSPTTRRIQKEPSSRFNEDLNPPDGSP